jgi:long-chain acyl-CoA synthetase
MLTHGGLLASASAMAGALGLGPQERLLSVLPLSHLFEQGPGLLTPLFVGASIVYPVSRQPAVLLRTFRDYRASMLLIVPQGLKLLDNAIERKVDQVGKRRAFERAHRLAARLPRALRRLLFRSVLDQLGGRLHIIGVGSAALDVDLARRWEEMGVQVLQGYGMTEMSPVVSFTRPGRNRLGTVGEAVPGVEIRIADDGELLLRGPNRFAGYWQNPEATARAFDSDGWYRSGDIGDLSADGFLTLRGRKKDMLALPDGQKVYPEDVEEVLARDTRLRDATVVGWPPGQLLKVHAVLLLEEGADGASLAQAIVREANGRLGAHQQIRSYTVWPDEDLPRTHTLKVRKPLVLERLAELEDGRGKDRTALRGTASLGSAGVGGATPLAAPARPTEGDRVSTVDAVAGLVAQVGELADSAVSPQARLSSDLNLDSLQRVELLGVIEEELGTYIDDADLDPEATVAELAALVEAAKGGRRETGIYGWPLHPLSRAIGIAVQALVTVPLLHVFYRIRRTGTEHLDGLEGPVLFTPNHCLHTDNLIVLTQLPLGWRWRLSIAAGAETIYDSPIQGFLASLLANAFPLAREGAIRRSLELLGARLDRGFSILIYPEGKLTVGGPLQPFQSGAGLVAVESATLVVPMKLRIHQMSRVDAPGNPWRGDVEVVFGEPIRFDSDADYQLATKRLEQAVASL